MQEKINPNSLEACETSQFLGKSRLYAISLETGRAELWDDGNTKYLEFDGIKFASFTLSEKGDTSTLVMAFRALHRPNAERDIGRHTGRQDALSRVKGLDALVIKMKGAGGRSNVVSNDSALNYWIYK
jgi:hypothetical protein